MCEFCFRGMSIGFGILDSEYCVYGDKRNVDIFVHFRKQRTLLEDCEIMNNRIEISGIVARKPEFSNESYGRKFYSFELESERTSGAVDKVRCLIGSELVNEVCREKVKVVGEIRSRKYVREGKCHLWVYVYVMDVLQYEEDDNFVEITGIVSAEPTFRKTPRGKTISDIFLRSYRNVNCMQYDRVPVVTWGNCARKTSELHVGSKVKVIGRLQSREYIKFSEDEKFEKRTVIEISAKEIEVEEL